LVPSDQTAPGKKSRLPARKAAGAPVYRDGYSDRGLTGLITEAVHVAIDVSRLEEIEKTPEHTTTLVQQEVTRYGLWVVLRDLAGWLDQVAPA
jgi:hypothetical protein